MNDITIIDKINIENMIYEVRGKQVMLDSEISATKWHDKEYRIYLVLIVLITLI